MGAGYWLNPDTGKCVQVITTHDEWVRDNANARSMGVPQWVYDEIMRHPPTAVDEIRLLALHCGLVRMREHPRYLSIQFAAERHRITRVLLAIATALSDLTIHADTNIRMDNLLLNDSLSITVAELQSRVESQQRVFPEDKDQGDCIQAAHPFLIELQKRSRKRAMEAGQEEGSDGTEGLAPA
jgi:hypothetical protein